MSRRRAPARCSCGSTSPSDPMWHARAMPQWNATFTISLTPGTAVLFDGSVYVRDGRDLPEATRGWFRAPRCGGAGTFEVTGDWLGVTGPRRPRFDGDLRPPYRLEVHVTSGPTRYVGATIMLRATRSTVPALTPSDVRTSLWRGGQVTASVRCTDRGFEALALDAG